MSTEVLKKSGDALWKRVQKTDPKYTKKVEYGKRKFTSVDPTYQAWQATKEWGPYGAAWGLRDFKWTFRTFSQGDKGPAEWIMLEADFFYPDGSFPIAADMRLMPHDDCTKKLRTECQSKALSLLGFNADVFMGMFDDKKYVEYQRARYEEEEVSRQRISVAIGRAVTEDALGKCQDRLDELFANEAVSEPLYKEMNEQIAAKRKELSND